MYIFRKWTAKGVLGWIMYPPPWTETCLHKRVKQDNLSMYMYCMAQVLNLYVSCKTLQGKFNLHVVQYCKQKRGLLKQDSKNTVPLESQCGIPKSQLVCSYKIFVRLDSSSQNIHLSHIMTKSDWGDNWFHHWESLWMKRKSYVFQIISQKKIRIVLATNSKIISMIHYY